MSRPIPQVGAGRTAIVRGFSLVELAVVMFIMALLLGGMVMPLSAQNEQRQRADTRKTMQEARDALMGFVMIQGRAPCPALTAPGAESPGAGGICTQQVGFLPSVTLGISEHLDGFGRPLRYAVSTQLWDVRTPTTVHTNVPTTANAMCTKPSGKYTLTDLRACSTPGGAQSYVTTGTATTCAAGEHSIGDRLPVALWSDGKDTTTPLDDLIDWPSDGILFGAMVKGGKC